MARGVNKVILVGNLTQDPEFKVLPNSETMTASVSLATNESYRDQQNQLVERAEYHRLVFWGRTAEIMRDYARKGSQIYAEGKLRTRTYDDKNGVRHYITEIHVTEMQLLGSPRGAQQGPNNYNANQPYGQNNMGNNQNYNAYQNQPQQNNFMGNNQQYDQRNNGGYPRSNYGYNQGGQNWQNTPRNYQTPSSMPAQAPVNSFVSPAQNVTIASNVDPQSVGANVTANMPDPNNFTLKHNNESDEIKDLAQAKDTDKDFTMDDVPF